MESVLQRERERERDRRSDVTCSFSRMCGIEDSVNCGHAVAQMDNDLQTGT